MDGCNIFRETKKHSTLKKVWLQLFSSLNAVTFKEEKRFFKNTAIFYGLLFHKTFCISANNCTSMQFQSRLFYLRSFNIAADVLYN